MLKWQHKIFIFIFLFFLIGSITYNLYPRFGSPIYSVTTNEYGMMRLVIDKTIYDEEGFNHALFDAKRGRQMGRTSDGQFRIYEIKGSKTHDRVMVWETGIMPAMQGVLFKKKAEINNDLTINFINDIQIDKDYLNALNTADEFLSAWLQRDVKKGKKYLSKVLLEELTEEDISLLISGISNPHHQGFEIIGANKISNNTIRFYVWLYENVTGSDFPSSDRPEPKVMDIVKVSEDQWLVGGFPGQEWQQESRIFKITPEAAIKPSEATSTAELDYTILIENKTNRPIYNVQATAYFRDDVIPFINSPSPSFTIFGNSKGKAVDYIPGVPHALSIGRIALIPSYKYFTDDKKQQLLDILHLPIRLIISHQEGEEFLEINNIDVKFR